MVVKDWNDVRWVFNVETRGDFAKVYVGAEDHYRPSFYFWLSTPYLWRKVEKIRTEAEASMRLFRSNPDLKKIYDKEDSIGVYQWGLCFVPPEMPLPFKGHFWEYHPAEGEGAFVLPAAGKVIRKESGTIVFVPDKDFRTFVIGRECGYRGGSEFEILSPTDVIVHPFKEYKSERGSLGISSYALVSAPVGMEIKVKETATGRLYGDDPEWVVIYKVTPEGVTKEEAIPEDLIAS